MTNTAKRLFVFAGAVVVAVFLYFASGAGEKEMVEPTTPTSPTPTNATDNSDATAELEDLTTVVANYLEARWSFTCTDTVEVRKQRILATGIIADPAMLDGLVLEVGATLREQECVAQTGSVEAVAYPDRLVPGHFEPDHADITMEVSFTMKDREGNALYSPDSAARTVTCEKIAGRWLVAGEE